MDVFGLAALGLVAAEWLALGTFSGVDWPSHHSTPWAARWGLRLLVGAGLIGVAQLLLAQVGVGFASIPLVLACAAVAAGGLRLLARGAACKTDPPRPPMLVRERAGWVVLGVVLLVATLRSLLVPEAGWDAYSHWGLRAQAFALGANVVSAHSEHEYYPPLVPLLEAWLYLHRGGVSIDFGKTIWALVGSAFAVCLAQHLRLSLASEWQWLGAWLGAAILVSTSGLLEGFWTGQADLALSAYVTLASLAVVQWQRAPDERWLIQAAVFGAAAALTKFEGLPRIGVVVAALGVEVALSRQRRGLIAAVVLGASAGVATLGWTLFELSHGITPNAEHLGQFQPLAIGSVLVSLAAVFGGVRTGGGLLVAALAGAVSIRHIPRLPALIVLGQLVATLVAFLLSDTSPEVEVRTAATRLFEQFLPLALFVGAVGLSKQMSTYNRPWR
jgi:hypothetical protein